MDDAVRALCMIEGAIAVLEDERAESTSPRLAACMGALEKAAELLGAAVDELESGA